MLRFSFRLLLSALAALQTVAPTLAGGWMIADDSCGCAKEYICCEPVVVECDACQECEASVGEESHDAIVGSCGCEAMETEAITTDEDKPVPADTRKPEATATPSTVETTDKLPPAPIAVPADPTNTTDAQIFPGPAATPTTEPPAASAPTTEPPASKPRTSPEVLFDEPVTPVAQPNDVSIPLADPPVPATNESTPSVEVTGTEETEGLFVEPSQAPLPDSSVEVEAEETVTEEAEPEQPAADPLDDLFGPSSPDDESAPKQDETLEEQPAELDTFDPFSRNELPALEIIFADAALRSWSNRQAIEHCQAKLVSVTTEGIFVVQASGELVEIGFAELSDADLNFIRNQILAQRDLLAPTQLAAH